MDSNKESALKKLEEEILHLKTELTEVKNERDAIKKQFDELKLKIIDERYDTSADSTVQEIMEMIFGSEVAPGDSTNTN